MARTTAKLINRQNKITILNLIRQKGSASRVELSRETGMSAPTVTRIVDSLINNEQLVREAGEGSSSGGRRPNLVSFAGDRYFVIGVDISPRYITAILTDLNSKILVSEKAQTLRDEGFEKVMSRVADLVNLLIDRSKVQKDKIIGVGLGVAGFIDIHEKILRASPNFGWENVHPDKELSKHIDYPVVYDNLTRVLAIGELHYGAGDRFDNFICLKIGMGLGSGVILNRKPFIGAHGFGSEVGHTIIDAQSTRQCKCGNYGCFEILASGQFILDRLESLIGLESFAEISRSDDPLEKAIAAIIKEPDRFAELLEELGLSLSRGLTNLIHSYDPEAIILGGVVAELYDLIIDSLRKNVKERVVAHFQSECEILKTSAGEKSIAMGAVALILEKVLDLSL